MSRNRRSRTNWLGPILIALIVTAVAWTVSERVPNVSLPTPANTSSTLPIAAASDTHTIVALGIPALSADRDQRMLVDLDSGSSTKIAVAKGWRIPDLTPASGVSLVPFGDGFKLAGTDWDIVLRRENGQLYIEPRVLGLLDATRAIVIARISTAQEILLVNRSGGIRKIADLPENANVLGLADGSIWLSTYIPGEGIESEPHGPSKLVRIEADGTQEVAATSDSVINRVIATYGYTAYGTEGGTYRVVESQAWTGQGTPLLWLPGSRLLVGRGTSLFVLDGKSEKRVSGALPGEPDVAVVVE